MTPSTFLALEALPLTPSGKIERAALPTPGSKSSELEDAYVAARSPTEQIVAEIWSDLLGVARVGVHDNFFILGGHSLLATRLVSRLRDTFNVDLPLRSLLGSPTVTEIAAQIEALRRANQDPSQWRINSAPRHPGLGLSPAQEQLWTLEQLLSGNSFFNIHTAFRLSGPLDVSALARCLNELIHRHEALRTTFGQMDGRPIQVISPGMNLPLRVMNLENLPGSERLPEAQRLQHEEGKRPFDLARGPLLRATLLRLADGDHIVFFTMHHIISDGWSIGILIRELNVLYEAFSRQQDSPLPMPACQFADFASWQREMVHEGRFDKELAYWNRQLAGNATPLRFSGGRSNPTVLSFRTDRCSTTFPTALIDDLRVLSRSEGATLFMTVLTGFKALLHHWTGVGDIRVGTLVANRSRTELEGVVGCLVNTLVLQTSLHGNPTLRELLQRVRQTAFGAYAHQDLPFEELLRNVQGGDGLERAGLFQVMLLLEDLSPPLLRLPRLNVHPFPPDQDQRGAGVIATTLDLMLRMTPASDGMVGTLTYKTDLFEASTAAGMLRSLQQVLERIILEPECRLSDL